MSLEFAPEETLGDGFARTSRELLLAAEQTLTEDAAANPARAVHAARKAIKKQRALLRLVRDAAPPKQRRRENAALRAAARRLSGSRDADVMIATLDELAERYAGQVPHPVFDTLRGRLQADRPVFSDLSPGGPEGLTAADLAEVRTRIESWTLRGGDRRAITRGLNRTYRDGRAAMRTALRTPSDENLHAWRKRVKDLWYELRLLRGVCGEVAGGQAREAHRLADLLGDDHDLAVLRMTLLRSAEIATDLDAVLALIDHRREQLRREARLIGARVYAEPPKDFVRRMRRLWSAGRRGARSAQKVDPAALAQATRSPGGADAASMPATA